MSAAPPSNGPFFSIDVGLSAWCAPSNTGRRRRHACAHACVHACMRACKQTHGCMHACACRLPHVPLQWCHPHASPCIHLASACKRKHGNLHAGPSPALPVRRLSAWPPERTTTGVVKEQAQCGRVLWCTFWSSPKRWATHQASPSHAHSTTPPRAAEPWPRLRWWMPTSRWC